MKRYYTLDMTKFLLTLMIAIFHLWQYTGLDGRGWFIGVEIFFVISGFFMARMMETAQNPPDSFRFLCDRIKKYYPHHLFSFAAMFLYLNFAEWRVPVSDALKNIGAQSTEVLLLHGTILSDENTLLYNSVTWYLSVLLLVGYILVAMLNRHRSAVITAAPIIVLEIYAYMAYTLGTANNWRTHVFGILNYGILRGIAGMLTGVLIWRLSTRVLRSFERLGVQRIYSCLVTGTLLIVGIPILSFRWFHMASFLYVGMGALAILCFVVGEKQSLFPEPVTRSIEFCQSITYAIYLNHFLVMRILTRILKWEYTWKMIPIYLASLLLYSAATTWVVQKLTQYSMIFFKALLWTKKDTGASSRS